MRRLIILLTTTILLSSHPGLCASNNGEEIYAEAINLLNAKKLSQAKEKLKNIEQIYPYSSSAMKAQFALLKIQYRTRNYEEAAFEAEQYIKNYPNSKYKDYIYYIIAMSYYKQIGLLGRDSSAALDALEAFNRIIAEHKETKYLAKAKLKQKEILDFLAAQEMKIAHFYLSEGNYIASIHRFKTVINRYKNTYYEKQALTQIIKILEELGLKTEAEFYQTNMMN